MHTYETVNKSSKSSTCYIDSVNGNNFYAAQLHEMTWILTHFIDALWYNHDVFFYE